MLKKLIIIIFIFLSSCGSSPTAPQPSSCELYIPDYDQIPPGVNSVNLCQTNSPEFSQVPLFQNQEPTSSNSIIEPVLSNLTQEFLNKLKNSGTNLNLQQLEQIRKLIRVQPTGEWDSSTINGVFQNSEQNLLKDFLNYSSLFDPVIKTKLEYKQKALLFARSYEEGTGYYLDTSYLTKKNIILVIKWNSITKEFIIIRSTGAIAHYLRVDNITEPRYIKIPDEL